MRFWFQLMLTVLAGASLPASSAWAWGATDHEWVGGIAVEKLPDAVPSFVRTSEAAAEIAVMGRELDRSKGSGKTRDAERDPGHHVDLADYGSVGHPPACLAAGRPRGVRHPPEGHGKTQYKAGYLLYLIVDGFQQLRKDSAHWRALTKAIETATTPEEKAWFEADRDCVRS